LPRQFVRPVSNADDYRAQRAQRYECDLAAVSIPLPPTSAALPQAARQPRRGIFRRPSAGTQPRPQHRPWQSWPGAMRSHAGHQARCSTHRPKASSRRTSNCPKWIGIKPIILPRRQSSSPRPLRSACQNLQVTCSDFGQFATWSVSTRHSIPNHDGSISLVDSIVLVLSLIDPVRQNGGTVEHHQNSSRQDPYCFRACR
jgi:hypothetical protein